MEERLSDGRGPGACARGSLGWVAAVAPRLTAATIVRVSTSLAEPERVRLHRERSAALHAAIADRVLREPELVVRARQKLAEWMAAGGRSMPLWQRWEQILACSPEVIARFLRDPSEEAEWLRKASPFAGVLAPQERWRVLREVRARLEGGP